MNLRLKQRFVTVSFMKQVSYALDNVVETNREFPDTYSIPSIEMRDNLKEGQVVKLVFRIVQDDEVDVERMWVIVKSKSKSNDTYVGVLDNDPFCTDQIKSGMEVRFQSQHILQIHTSE